MKSKLMKSKSLKSESLMTVNEVSKLTGVSIRTLQYYDKIGLLPATGYTDARYRLYDNAALEKLQQIMLFKELEFSLKEIRQIIDAPDFDREKALEQQIELLILKKEHLENLIDFAREIQKKEKTKGVKEMDFKAFDKSKIEEYAKVAKDQWGHTEAYKEYEEKALGQPEEEQMDKAQDMMQLFVEFGALMKGATAEGEAANGQAAQDPAGEAAQAQVKKLQDFITANYYTCTKEILAGLGQMYGAGGEFTENIDKAGGAGTAAFAAEAIAVYCR